jgi:hypothetical protein
MTGVEYYQKIKNIDKAKACFITAYEESLYDFKKLFPIPINLSMIRSIMGGAVLILKDGNNKLM